MQKRVIRYIIIFSLLFFTSQVFAAGDSNNEIVKVDLDQTAEGSVKVNIYTDKPYKEQIIVNKKPNNKYVILLPETTNSTSGKPDISGLSSVNDVEVKTQQYSSLPGKGYTKITIDGKTPIEVVPQAFVTKRASSQKQSSTKPYVSAQQVQMTVPQRVLNQQKPVTNNDFVPSYERQRQTNQAQNNNFVQTSPATSVPQYTQNPQPQQTTPAIAPAVTQQVSVEENSTPAVEDNIAETDSKQAVDDASAGQVEDDIPEDDLVFFKKFIRFKHKVVRKINK